MAYASGARVRLTRDVQVTGDDTAARTGRPGPLFLAEGLAGVVTGSTKEAGGVPQDNLASFEQAARGGQFDSFTAGLIDDLHQRVIRMGVSDPESALGSDTGCASRTGSFSTVSKGTG
ncbi:hypothetical protein KCMC57_up55430 [Kitasatospora sp. CMC57]|uniref:Uncharacterized protein n=1 Tax=Kitasatospora sp. CMC57 TaxID=3231513 RepID=A0AB33K9M2_9ACTN